MKILMLGWELPPHFVGGMGTVCYSLCQFLAKSGADIEFILPFEADYSSIDFMRVNPYSDAQTKAITYEDLYRVHATAYGKADISTAQAKRMGAIPLDSIQDIYARKVAKVSLLGEYDVIHAHDWLTMRAALVAKQITGVPLIVHVHATEFDRAGATGDEEWGDPSVHEIEYAGLLAADKIIAVSQHTKNILVRRYCIDPNKIEVVHNSIDLDAPYLHVGDDSKDPYAGLRVLQQHGYKIVFNIGRHTIQKGLTQLLDAAALAISKDPKLLFLLIGNGDQHHELMEYAAHLGISQNVIFTGFKSGIYSREAFKLADAFIMPSVSEPFGTTALEALGFGAPVIVSKQSGVSEMIKTAFKVDFWDIRAMADKILAITHHNSLASHMREAGFKEMDDITYAKCASGTMHTYHKALGVAV